jgi:transcriptional regulator with XRE-family HTH domain
MAKRPDIPAHEFGARLRRLRGAARQQPIAERLGITQSELSRYERGRVPDAAMLLHIARTYDVTVDYLLTGKHPAAPAPRLVGGKVVKFERVIDRPPLREAVAVVTALFEGADKKRTAELLRILVCLRDLLPGDANPGGGRRRKPAK